MSLLQKRFDKSRKNVFKTRQRINDCLTDLKQINLIHKTKGTYWFNLFEIHLLIEGVRIRNEIKKYEEKERAEYLRFENEIKNLSK